MKAMAGHFELWTKLNMNRRTPEHYTVLFVVLCHLGLIYAINERSNVTGGVPMLIVLACISPLFVLLLHCPRDLICKDTRHNLRWPLVSIGLLVPALTVVLHVAGVGLFQDSSSEVVLLLAVGTYVALMESGADFCG